MEDDRVRDLFNKRRRATVKDFSQHFGKSEETVRRWCRRQTDFLAPLGLSAEKDPGGKDWLIIRAKQRRLDEET